jgi:hypothetical protein
MDDPILPEAPAAPAVPAPSAEGDRLERLESSMAELTATVRDAAAALRNTPAPQGPQRTPDEFLSDLATDPRGVIRNEATQAAREMMAQSLNPAVLQVLENGNAQLMRDHEATIDSEFGEGTYSEIFKPQLDRDIAQLKQVNPRAIADPQTMDALVNRLYGGQNFHMLSERRQAFEKTAQVRGLSHLLPRGGVPRLRVGNPAEELGPDHEQFLREVEKATGETKDRKQFARLLHTGRETGPGRHRTDLADYLAVTGADKVTKEKYGCS